MSKTTATAKSAAKTSARNDKPTTRNRAEVGPAMFGRDILVQALER